MSTFYSQIFVDCCMFLHTAGISHGWNEHQLGQEEKEVLTGEEACGAVP